MLEHLLKSRTDPHHYAKASSNSGEDYEDHKDTEDDEDDETKDQGTSWTASARNRL